LPPPPPGGEDDEYPLPPLKPWQIEMVVLESSVWDKQFLKRAWFSALDSIVDLRFSIIFFIHLFRDAEFFLSIWAVKGVLKSDA
jgi:hypothetical protein